MNKTILNFFIVLICFIGVVYGLICGILGNAGLVYHPEIHKLNKALNMNDAEDLTLSKDGYIYVVGRTAVQRFNMDGSYCDGIYLAVPHQKDMTPPIYVSLHDDNIYIYDKSIDIIYTFNNQFDLVGKKTAYSEESIYTSENFYSEYPNNSAEGKEIRFTFTNKVRIDGETVELAAPRNIFKSSMVGWFVFSLSIMVVMFYFFPVNFTDFKKGFKAYFSNNSRRL